MDNSARETEEAIVCDYNGYCPLLILRMYILYLFLVEDIIDKNRLD